MRTELWVLLGVAVVLALGLVYFIVTQLVKGKRDFDKIDYSKLREWKDDEW